MAEMTLSYIETLGTGTELTDKSGDIWTLWCNGTGRVSGGSNRKDGMHFLINRQKEMDELTEKYGFKITKKAYLNFKMTSHDWVCFGDFDFEVVDPDGWDRSNYRFSFYEEKIDKEEFLKRCALSTCVKRK